MHIKLFRLYTCYLFLCIENCSSKHSPVKFLVFVAAVCIARNPSLRYRLYPLSPPKISSPSISKLMQCACVLTGFSTWFKSGSIPASHSRSSVGEKGVCLGGGTHGVSIVRSEKVGGRGVGVTVGFKGIRKTFGGSGEG